MWIDDSSADVIKADFEALYHGDMLVEGETSEQFEDWQPAAYGKLSDTMGMLARLLMAEPAATRWFRR